MGCSSSSPAAVPAAAAGGSGSSGPPNGATGGTEKDAAAPTSEKPAPPAPAAAAAAAEPPLGLADYDDPSSDEPRVPVAVGYRRGSLGPAGPPGDESPLPARRSPAAAGRGGTLPRMGSSKNVPLGGAGPSSGEGSAAGGPGEGGNIMQNIHSSPFQPQTAFEAPVFPKSDEDVEFV